MICLQERTPGVGMELTLSPTEDPPAETEGDGGREEEVRRPDPSELQELRERIAKIEAEIEDACEKEDYDLAGIHPKFLRHISLVHPSMLVGGRHLPRPIPRFQLI